MPIITQGLYRVELFQEYFSQQCINTFWYRSNDGLDTGADEVADRFDTVILPAIAAIQNTGVVYDNIRVTPIFGLGTETNLTPGTAGGGNPGTPMPAFMAASLRLIRATNELRSGWKRFCGLTEEETGGTSFAGSYTTVLNSLATQLGLNLVGTTDFYWPVIVRRPFTTLPPLPDYYYTGISNVQVLNRPTTQNSRKDF